MKKLPYSIGIFETDIIVPEQAYKQFRAIRLQYKYSRRAP